jgi:hypothetical protein
MTDHAITFRYTEGPISPPDDDSEWEVVSTCAIPDGIAITWRRVEGDECELCGIEHEPTGPGEPVKISYFETMPAPPGMRAEIVFEKEE